MIAMKDMVQRPSSATSAVLRAGVWWISESRPSMGCTVWWTQGTRSWRRRPSRTRCGCPRAGRVHPPLQPPPAC